MEASRMHKIAHTRITIFALFRDTSMEACAFNRIHELYDSGWSVHWKPLDDLIPASVVSELPSPIATYEEIIVAFYASKLWALIGTQACK